MGDIDSTNFNEEVLEQFTSAVNRASFISVDLEMTGISFQSATGSENGGDTVALRYEKIKQVAAAFNVIQVGVAVFGEDACSVYNFYVFPRPVTEGSVDHIPVISMCSASTNFNRSHGMDFSRWVRDGITYVDSALESKLRAILLEDTASGEKAWNRLLSSFSGLDDQQKSSPEYASQEQRVLDEIEAMIADNAVTTYKVPFIHGGQKYLKSILSSVHEKFPQLRLVEEVSGGGSSRVISKQTCEELFNEYIGFRRVWSALTGCGKPVVFHNGFLDLMFCYQAFENELPLTILEFKKSLKSLFPGGVFDTRLIAIESGLSMAGSAALETLAEMFTSEIPVTNSGKYNSDAMAEERFHEAGYDALLTGKVFLGLKAKTDIEQWKNFMCVSRCLWVLSVDTLDADRLLLDCGVGKVRIVRILSDMNPSVNTRDVLSAFEDVKTVVPATVNIQWIDNAGGILLVTWTQPQDKSVDAVTTAVSAKLLEIVKAGSGLGETVKLATPQEYVKKQLEEISPEAIMAQKRFRF